MCMLCGWNPFCCVTTLSCLKPCCILVNASPRNNISHSDIMSLRLCVPFLFVIITAHAELISSFAFVTVKLNVKLTSVTSFHYYQPERIQFKYRTSSVHPRFDTPWGFVGVIFCVNHQMIIHIIFSHWAKKCLEDKS